MQLEILTTLIFLLTAYDSYLTTRRFNDYGEIVEVNRGIRWLSKLTSPEIATILLLFGPTLFWVLLAIKFNLVGILGFMAGFKLRFFYNQLESVHFEKEAKQVQALINSRVHVLPSQNKDANASPSQMDPKDLDVNK